MHSALILWSKQNSFHKTVIFFTSFTHRLSLIYIDTGIRFFTKGKKKWKMDLQRQLVCRIRKYNFSEGTMPENRTFWIDY